ncbi:MAG TPA: AAA family ATPase, partial [Thermomicrobiales bacterium]|nr:AAA family ATPase [Thermomicrobiales bacterium]
PGVLGVAADLVEHEPRFATLARGLLGRVLVVEDLATTRAVLPRLGGGWSVVTRGGEIARASGAVTGGAATRESGLLARERTLRELPRALDAREEERAAAAEALTERAATTRALRDELAAHEPRARDAARADDDARHRATRARRDHEALAAAVADLERRLAQLDRDGAALDAELTALGAGEDDLAARLAALEAERAAAQEALDAAEAAGATERPRLVALRADLARAEERRRGLRREREALDAREEALRREAGERADREAALGRESRDLEAALASRAADLATLEEEQAALEARLEPLDATLATGERDLAATGAALTAANEDALRREAALGAEAVETARRRGDRDALARRVGDELDDADPAGVLAAFAADDTAPLPADERAALASQVERLAQRLRRLGAPDPDILAEHEGEAARWRFLTEQLGDVESALRSLRGVLAELDEALAARFAATFARVAAEFRETFADLFGGGSARLVLIEPDGDGAGAGGVEIVAQPPGKRLQSLSLLSGGERALTAAALLFAILRVNPSPFCVLDEVDAALDESNVVRFRERLKRLADRTQFVVITHNRGTIEGADTLYGITMGADGVSRVLSLRLSSDERQGSDERRAPAPSAVLGTSDEHEAAGDGHREAARAEPGH